MPRGTIYQKTHGKPNNLSYRGPADAPARPEPWPHLLTLLDRHTKASEIEAWYAGLPENERVDIRHGCQQAILLVSSIAKLNIPDLFRGTIAEVRDAEKA